MSIIVDQNTRVVVQGITGGEGSFHAAQMKAYGTKMVAGVTPGKGGTQHEGTPVFNGVAEAVRKEGANASIIFVPASFATDAIMESADAGIAVIICITEGIPTLDMVKAVRYVAEKKARLIGPNCPGIISPGKCKIGIMPGDTFLSEGKKKVGLISRSGTLTYEAVKQLSELGIAQSTAIGIGGDPIVGSIFTDLLPLFEADPETDGVLVIGEIGGNAEEDAARLVKARMKKPVAAFVAGMTAPPGRRLGHAGPINSGGKGTATEKIQVFRECGVAVAQSPAEIGSTVAKMLKLA